MERFYSVPSSALSASAVVKINSRDNEEWVKIVAPNGKKGYVFSRYIRRPIDHRACFEKKQGRWLMTALVTGD